MITITRNIIRPYVPLLFVTPEEHLYFPDTAGQPFGFVLEVNLSDETFDKEIAAKLISGSHPFVLCVRGDVEVIKPDIMHMITLCLFSKEYILVNGNPVIAFMEGNSKTGKTTRQLAAFIKAKLTAQGWPSIEEWHFPKTTLRERLKQTGQLPLLIDTSSTYEIFESENLWDDFKRLNGYVLFRRNTLVSAIQQEQHFFDVCSSILHNNPEMGEALQEYVKVKNIANALKTQNALLLERLHNAEKTIQVIRSKYKDDYDLLFNWYQKEYEVLPLWYKRIGHIIKVLMGKRTFKSLFK